MTSSQRVGGVGSESTTTGICAVTRRHRSDVSPIVTEQAVMARGAVEPVVAAAGPGMVPENRFWHSYAVPRSL